MVHLFLECLLFFSVILIYISPFIFLYMWSKKIANLPKKEYIASSQEDLLQSISTLMVILIVLVLLKI